MAMEDGKISRDEKAEMDKDGLLFLAAGCLFILSFHDPAAWAVVMEALGQVKQMIDNMFAHADA